MDFPTVMVSDTLGGGRGGVYHIASDERGHLVVDGFLCPMLLVGSVGKFIRFGTYPL